MRFYIPILVLLLPLLAHSNEQNQVQFNWSAIATLPGDVGNEHPGLAGAFTGVHNNALIIAGGANFPNGMVWEGGEKEFHKDIYILERRDNDTYRWFTQKRFFLQQQVAYGLTIITEDGLLCIGGNDGSRDLNNSFWIKWDAKNRNIEIEEFPDFPIRAANLSGGRIGNKVYVAASSNTGQKFFGSIDITNTGEGWVTLPVWGGLPRTHAAGVIQSNGETDCFFLFKGRFKGAEKTSVMLVDSYEYNPTTNQWTQISIQNDFPHAAGTAIPQGANHILFFGGDDGKTFNRLELLASTILTTVDPIERNALIVERDEILKSHPGFSKDILAFHTITHSWAKIGELQNQAQVTTTALSWDGQILIPSGEVAPSVRTPKIYAGSISSNTSFGTINYAVLIAYLAILVWIGFLYSKKQHSTEDFFKGGRRIPGWAAGLSIFGTQLSAITFMAIPAKTFATDWLYFFLMMTIIMVAPLIIRYFLPFYRRFNLTTAYEYLELRFNLATRLSGSVMYIFLQLGRLGIVLLLPSLALSVVTGINVYACILTMGVLSIIYTVLGGIEAVIWTDVVQVIVLLGGALLSLAILFFNLDSTEISHSISTFKKMRIFDFELSFTHPTLWVVLIGGLASNIVQYGSDQTVIQRYLTTKDEKSAARSISIGTWLTLPATLIFFTLGTLLFVYYQASPELLTPTLDKTDAIFPWFIVNSLPPGVSGLLIAAVFAASMSSLDSSMNSVSTVITTDFLRRLRPLNNEIAYLKVARMITVIIGVIGTLLALLMATWGISSLWDQFNMIVGLFAGGLGGVFLLGIFSKKANGTGALIGLLASGLAQFMIKEYTSIHLLMYAFTGMLTSVALGYLLSLVFGNPSQEKIRYVYFNLKKKR